MEVFLHSLKVSGPLLHLGLEEGLVSLKLLDFSSEGSNPELQVQLEGCLLSMGLLCLGIHVHQGLLKALDGELKPTLMVHVPLDVDLELAQLGLAVVKLIHTQWSSRLLWSHQGLRYHQGSPIWTHHRLYWGIRREGIRSRFCVKWKQKMKKMMQLKSK